MGARTDVIVLARTCCVVPARMDRTGTMIGPFDPSGKTASCVVTNCTPSAVVSVVFSEIEKVDAAPAAEVK